MCWLCCEHTIFQSFRQVVFPKPIVVSWLSNLIIFGLIKGYLTILVITWFNDKLCDIFVSPDQQVFDLLWCLVCHDIWFVWERSQFLQQAEGQMLTSKPFSVSISNKCTVDKLICSSDRLLLAHQSCINFLWLKCAFIKLSKPLQSK